MVRAKFRCDAVEPNTMGGGGDTIRMSPVYDPNPDSENGKFFSATPGGNLWLSCVNPDATAQFEAGKEYYLDFTPASEPVTA